MGASPKGDLITRIESIGVLGRRVNRRSRNLTVSNATHESRSPRDTEGMAKPKSLPESSRACTQAAGWCSFAAAFPVGSAVMVFAHASRLAPERRTNP